MAATMPVRWALVEAPEGARAPESAPSRARVRRPLSEMGQPVATDWVTLGDGARSQKLNARFRT